MPEGMSEGIAIEVRGPGGARPPLTVPFNRVTIGSGAHCEVQLPPEHAALEHVELTVVNGRVFARARVFDPAPTIEGSPFVQTFLEPGAPIGIGPFQIVAAPIAVEGKGEASAKRSPLRSPVAIGFVLLTAVLAAAAGLKRGQGDATAIAETPPLWSATAAACPQSIPGQALALAAERRVVAEGKRERRPFHVQDGVAAVSLFETAAACFRAGGDDGAATSASQAATDLRAKVDGDYHAHQVRLEHALLVNDPVVAQREVRLLRAFTESSRGPYAVWLSNLDRRLQLQLTKEHPS